MSARRRRPWLFTLLFVVGVTALPAGDFILCAICVWLAWLVLDAQG